jgi:multidrug efflux pump
VSHGWLYRTSEKFFTAMLGGYRRSLAWCLNNWALTLVVLVLVIALNVAIIAVIPTGFFPQQDTGVIMGGLQGPQDASFGVMRNSAMQVSAVIKADPAVDHVVAFTGGQGNTNGGFVFMALKPLEQRKVSATAVLARLRAKLGAMPVAATFLQPAQDLRIGGRQSNALYQYTIQSDSAAELNQWGPVLLRQMRALDGFQDVNSDQQNNGQDHYLTPSSSTLRSTAPSDSRKSPSSTPSSTSITL